ncbi:MAG: murein biosynthesis integral membrane protein MurJ [Chloroflexi bacterium]|nr:murein biosynthesis integral membrane protein MurJ [Chloroflexota bacterium]
MEGPTTTANEGDARFRRPSLASAAAIVAAGFLASRLLGLLRSVAIADSFGDSPELGAYWVAFRLPDLIFQLLAGATLGSAFIPTFARLFTKQSEEDAWRLASSILNIVFIATIVFAIIGFLFAPLLVPAMAPGLSERDLAVELTRVMMLSPILFAVSGMFMGILNARHHFLFPAFAPVFYNLAIITGALFFDSVQALAVAVVIGAALHLIIQVPALAIVGMVYRPIARWRDAAVQEVGKLMAPRVIGLAAVQFNFLITIFFASMVSDQAISAVTFAFLIMMTPLGLFGMAISTAVFPTMAEQAADDRTQLRRTLEQSLRLILFLTIPAGLGLMLLAEPIVAVLLQHGSFGEAATGLTQAALIFYGIGLFAHAAIEILSRGFYAVGDTRTPVLFAVSALVVNLILSAALVGPLEIRGLALAVSLAAILEAGLLFAALGKRLGGLDIPSIGRSLWQTMVAALLMTEMVGFYLILLHQAGRLDTGRFTDAFLAVGGSAVLGGLVFLAAAKAMRSQEFEILYSRVPFLRRAGA